MSAGAIFQQTLRILCGLALPDLVQEHLLAVVEAGRPGPLPLLNEAAYEAGLPREEILTRCTGIFLSFCAGNLADDLMDGDCTYLDPPAKLGPCLQFLVQNLAY